MSDLTIRPTAKFLKVGTAIAAIVFLGLEVAYLALWTEDIGRWFLIIPPLVLIWPAVKWVQRQYTKAVVTADRLRYEQGATSKSTRNIQLANLQDVRVDQRLLQRMWGVGDLSLETSGETSRLTIENVDNPQALADEIMNRAHNRPVS